MPPNLTLTNFRETKIAKTATKKFNFPLRKETVNFYIVECVLSFQNTYEIEIMEFLFQQGKGDQSPSSVILQAATLVFSSLVYSFPRITTCTRAAVPTTTFIMGER